MVSHKEDLKRWSPALAVVVAMMLNLAVSGMGWAATEADRKAEVNRWDKKKLRFATGVVTDSAKEFLKIPDGMGGKRDFEVAKAVPEIDFAPIRGQNPYLGVPDLCKT